jgi:hypothetical protein
MFMEETAQWNLNKWGERIFGRPDNKTATAWDGEFGAHIGHEPELKEEVSYLNSPLEDALDPGSGELGKILLDFTWNSRVSVMGYAEMGKSLLDQKFWVGELFPGFESPTIRGIVDMVSTILGKINPLAAYVDDLIFGFVDMGMGYRSIGDVTKSWAGTAVNALVSMGSDYLMKASTRKAADDLILANLPGRSGKNGWDLGKKIVQKLEKPLITYASNVAANTLNYLDFNTGSFDSQGFAKSLYSTNTIASTLSSLAGEKAKNSLGVNLNAANKKLYGGLVNLAAAGAGELTRYGVYAADSLISGSGNIAERLGQAYDNMGGVTLNIADLGSILDFMGTLSSRLGENYDTKLGELGQLFTGVGLVELNLGYDGAALSLGTGGINVAASLYSTAKHGLDYLAILNGNYDNPGDRDLLLTNYLWGDWAAENTSMRIEAGRDLLLVDQDNSLINGNSLGYTTRRIDQKGRLITIADMGSAEANALILQHESYRDGYTTSGNNTETFQAVLSHTQMAERMLKEGVDLPLNANLATDLLAYTLSGGNMDMFASYVAGYYDSGEDYWKLTEEGNIIFDGSMNLYDKDGNLIKEYEGDGGYYDSLAQIIKAEFDRIEGLVKDNSLMGKAYTDDYVCTTFARQILKLGGYDPDIFFPEGTTNVVKAMELLGKELITPGTGYNPTPGVYVFYKKYDTGGGGHTGIIYFDEERKANILHNGGNLDKTENVNLWPRDDRDFNSWFGSGQPVNPVKYMRLY